VDFETGNIPTRPEVEQQLERIKLSRRFRRAGTSLGLLKFLLEASLYREELSEHQVGVRFYGRGEDWVPMDDNIVRMGRHNLQHYLAEYYVTEGQHDTVVIDIPNGQIYRAMWMYSPSSLVIRRCAEGFEDTRKMFLGCGSRLDLKSSESGKGEWRVIGESARPEDYFDQAIAVDADNRLAAAGKAEAILTRALFRPYVKQSVAAAKREVERLGGDLLPWRGEIVLSCINACEGNWDRYQASFADAVKQLSLEKMDDVWSLLLVTFDTRNVADQHVGSVRVGGKDGLEETQLGLIRYMGRDLVQAMDDLLYAQEVSARARVGNFMARFLRGCVCLAQGDATKAEELFRSCVDKWDIRGFLVLSLMAVGKEAEAKKLGQCIEESTTISAFQKAVAEIAGGNGDAAVEWLRKAYAEGDPWMWFVRLWPVLDPLRHNEKFKKLLAEIEAARK
jgi:hypothetical protein